MPRELLDFLMKTAGQPASNDHVQFVGADPVFASVFPFGEAGAAAIAAVALQAACLWEMRSGRMQDLRVHVDHAAAAMRSTRYLKVEPIPGQPDPAVVWNERGKTRESTFRTRDG